MEYIILYEDYSHCMRDVNQIKGSTLSCIYPDSRHIAASTVCLFSEFAIKVGMLIPLHGCRVHARLRLVNVQRYTVAVYKTHYPLAEKQV